MTGRLQILVVCSDPENRKTLLGVLTQCGLELIISSTVSEARAVLARQAFPLVICEADLAGGSFRDLLRATQAAGVRIPVVVASRLDNTHEYLEAMQLGAFDYIAGPFRRSDVEWIVSQALRNAYATAA